MGSMREGKNFFQMSSDVQTFRWSAVSAAREEERFLLTASFLI